MDTARDPVCGMNIETDKAAASSQYDGRTYYFCAQRCKQMFDRNPEQYVEKEKSQGK